ncbi:hypothetical protein EDB85DRAFT_1891229 [Lactarius pseudohatsudake]|nr:hypothetical protein EDB85DRAFT_1891229 [Lactarius pseudohatsudake]
MPHDPETGKAIRIKFTEEDLYDFRFQQYEKKLNQAGKEGGVAEDHSPEHLQSQPTASGSNLSPSSVLERPLHGMTLESGGSSHADSPATQPGSASSPASFYIEVPKFGSKFRQPSSAALPYHSVTIKRRRAEQRGQDCSAGGEDEEIRGMEEGGRSAARGGCKSVIARGSYFSYPSFPTDMLLLALL